MGWRIFQAAIVLAVVCSNIHWQWTDNVYLASIIGIGAAWIVTATTARLGDLMRH